MIAIALIVASSLSSVPGIGTRVARATGSGPLAEWTFDEGSGTTATDVTGHGHDGTLSGGATWQTSGAKQGAGALMFGWQSTVSVPASAELETPSFTALAWLKTSDPASLQVMRMGSRTVCDGPDWSVGVYPMNGDAGYGSFTVRTPGGGSWQMGTFGAKVYDGSWHLIAYAYDAASGIATTYFDGAGPTFPGVPTIEYASTDRGMSIGIADPCHPSYVAATESLDDVRLYDRALSAAEVNAFLPHSATTTAAVWPSDPVPVAGGTPVTVTVAPLPEAGGLVTLYEETPGGPTTIGTAWLMYPSDSTTVYIEGDTVLPEGDYSMRVGFSAGGIASSSRSASQTVQIRRQPNPVTLGVDHATRYAGQPIVVTATAAHPTASIALWDAVDGGAATKVDTASPVGGPNGYTSTFTIVSATLGSHEYLAVTADGPAYLEATSDPQTVDVTKRPTTVSLSFGGVAQANHPIAVVAVPLTTDPIGLVPDGAGTITLTEDANVIGTLPITSGQTEWDFRSLTAGTHAFSATYSGTDLYASSTQDGSVEIVTDAVEAAGIGVAYSTFYPYKDGYRDTVAIRGTRNEPISVSIRVYSPLNKVVRSTTVASGTAGYSYTWNGRNSAGTVLAAGKYRVVQVLTDGAGNHLTVTSYVTLSLKKLYTYTVTQTQRNPEDIDAGGRYVGWIGWKFTVPSAQVYRSIKFSTYGKASTNRTWVGLLNFIQGMDDCAVGYWDPACVGRQVFLTSTLAWRSGTGYTQYNISHRAVQLMVWVGSGTAWVRYGRITVTYSILK